MELDAYGWPRKGPLDVRRLPTRTSHRHLPHLDTILERLAEYHRRLFAGGRYSVLLVVQGLDAAGKDSLIRTLAQGLDPAAFRANSFRRPLGEELQHDFLWRLWRHLPARGQVVAFNRSYYEAVLSERLWPSPECPREPDWAQRYQAINAFEQHLHNEGTRIIKIWLNTSAEEQRLRLLKRLRQPRKRWKFEPADVQSWLARDSYLMMLNEAMTATHTVQAPWHIVANDDKKVARRQVGHLLADILEALAPSYPQENTACIEQYIEQLEKGGD
ncbi:hypothetical protein A11A3_05299 [Alcanivorax hongdengensis A-11-3]|uniref:Polyphosphate kinase-2-related domain-containing protein n=1 Tax=Alcanivorax hongdengensis A-11-3 TaxID=1177179 RepID=L0WG01_9GAMM|nr:polyphosphate kinase [Alcanivorax hongdengensis]EKF75082.1 hypothetical protein A11A3_05299 [Alcanivorax hongdengensis A-11-3]